MRAAVLAGGLGMRLRPYTAVLPKPLVPVGNRPILELIFNWLAEHEVESVDVCLGYLGQLIQTYFSQPGTVPDGLHVRWRWEREPLGTAGALHCIDDLEESLLVVNGDVVTDLDPRDMMAFHHGRGAALTIATRTTVVETELGVIEHQQGAVTGYREKPVLHYAASMGVYCYEPHVIAGLASEPVQFPDLVVKLLAHGEVVSAYLTDASWSHIGTQAQHAEAVRLLADDPARDWLD